MEKTVNGAAKEATKEYKHAKDLVQSTTQTVASEAQDLMSTSAEYLQETLTDIRATAKRAVEASEDVIKKNPFTTILGAAAVGAVVGVILSRSSRRH